MRRITAAVTLGIFILFTFTGCGLLQKLGLQKAEDLLHPASSIVMGEEEAKKLTDKVPVYLYFANEDNTRLKLETRYIPVADAKKSTAHLAGVIVNELIKGPVSTNGFKATIPAGTKIKGPVTVKDGVAVINFSREFKSKHQGGKDAEKMTIFSVVNSLTELKDIHKVRFTIEGKTQKEYMGNFQFDIPFPRSTGMIIKEPAPKVQKQPDNTQLQPGTKQPDTKLKQPENDGKKKTNPFGSNVGNEDSKDVSGDDIEFLE